MDKNTYRIKAKQHIDTIFAKIDELDALKEKSQGELKAEFHQKVEELKSKRDEIKRKYEALENASEEKWHEAKQAFSSASDSFVDGFSRIAALLK